MELRPLMDTGLTGMSIVQIRDSYIIAWVLWLFLHLIPHQFRTPLIDLK